MKNPFKFKDLLIIIIFFTIGFVSAKLAIITNDLYNKDKQIKEIQKEYINIVSEYNEIHKNIEVLLNE